jgi:hypothetical protein
MNPDSRQAGRIASAAPLAVARDVLSEVVVKVAIINHVTVGTCFGLLLRGSNRNTSVLYAAVPLVLYIKVKKK